jgi:hypothetical protein
MISCEKIRWIAAHGPLARWLAPSRSARPPTVHAGAGALADESRPVAAMLMTKEAHVYYEPLGVIGVIVPWVCAPPRAPEKTHGPSRTLRTTRCTT